jgi:hypothetical protein
MTICNVKSVLEVIGPIVGLFAAAAWIISAWYGRPLVSYQAIETTMVQQSRWNAYAAIFAAICALAQVSTSFMPVCRGFD